MKSIQKIANGTIGRINPKLLQSDEKRSITPTTEKRGKVQDVVNIDNYNQQVQKAQKTKANPLVTEWIKNFVSSLISNVSIEILNQNNSFFEKQVDQIATEASILQKSFQEMKRLEEKLLVLDESVKKTIGINYSQLQEITFEAVYQENINKVQQIDEEKPFVLHYGIVSEQLSGLAGTYLSKDILHPIEQHLFKKAFQTLGVADSAEVYIKGNKQLYPNNVVLVDFFVRDENNTIKQDGNTEQPETHTIALWKKKENEIVLIDPSKADFSNYLPLLIINNFQFKIQPLFKAKEILYGSQGKGTGYSAYNDPDPKPRDCVDIAVKIGLELNEQQRFSNDLEVIENNMLSQISNQKNIAPCMNLVKNIFVRTLQSTNRNMRNSALYTLQQALYIPPKK